MDFYPHSMRERDVAPYFISMDEGYRQLFNPYGVYHRVDASEPGTYLQWNLPYRDW